MKKFFFLAVTFISFVGACERDPIVTDLAPLSPTAQVVGIVDNALTAEPLSNFLVEIIGGQSVTGAEGRFSIDAVAAGPSIPISISAPGFVDAVFNIDVASVGGVQDNALTGVGPIGLLPLLDDVQANRIRVLTEDGAPVDDVTIDVVLDRAFLNAGVWQGQHRGEAVFEETGEYSVRGLADLTLVAAISPDANLNLVIRPPSDQSELGTYVRSVPLSTFFASAPFVAVMPSAVLPEFRLVDSNLEELIVNETLESPSVLPTGEVLELGFTRPVAATEFNIDVAGAITPITDIIDGDIHISFIGAEPGEQFSLSVASLTEDFSRAVDVFTETPVNKSLGNEAYSITTLIGGFPVCPTNEGNLVLDLNAQIGGRNILGEPAINYSKISVTIAGLTLDAVPLVAASGFTDLLTIAWPGVNNPVGQNTVDFVFQAPLAGELPLKDPSGTRYQDFSLPLQLDISLCN